MPKKITIVKIEASGRGINHDLQWLSQSLGMFSLRDKEKSCFRIFVELLKAAKNNKPISSDELAYKLNLTRGTVVHHLKKLKASGIVVIKGKGYILRVRNLNSLIREIKKDMDETLGVIQGIAKSIDKALNMDK
ncbi:MAG: helix-turn-helix domain-containing protein [Candidatus Woesearchaeota archaeon]